MPMLTRDLDSTHPVIQALQDPSPGHDSSAAQRLESPRRFAINFACRGPRSLAIPPQMLVWQTAEYRIPEAMGVKIGRLAF